MKSRPRSIQQFFIKGKVNIKLIGTDASGGADAKQHDITTVGVVQELDEFMQHYGDGWYTHTVLGRDITNELSIIHLLTTRKSLIIILLRNKKSVSLNFIPSVQVSLQ